MEQASANETMKKLDGNSSETATGKPWEHREPYHRGVLRLKATG